MQEVVCGAGGGDHDQLVELAHLLGYEWTVRVIAEIRPHETEDEGVAVLSRLPLHSTAVWPLPPSHPPRHRLETSIDWQQQPLRLMTLHAAVSNRDGRDAQIAALTDLTGTSSGPTRPSLSLPFATVGDGAPLPAGTAGSNARESQDIFARLEPAK